MENFEHYFGLWSRAIGFYSRAIGDLREGLCHLALPSTVVSTPVPVAGHCSPTPLHKTLRHSQVGLTQSPLWSLLLSPGPWCAQILFVPSKCSCFPQSYESSLIKSHWPLKSSSLGISQILRLGRLTWCLEPSQQCENFFGIIVLQFMSHPLCRYGIWFYHNCSSHTASLWLLLCPWIWGVLCWWIPVSSFSGCSTVSWDFGALAEEDEFMSFYSAILIFSLLILHFNVKKFQCNYYIFKHCISLW